MAAKALSHQMSRAVRVNRLNIVNVLTENRARHIAAFNEAMAGYKELALRNVDLAFDGIDKRLAQRKADIVKKIDAFTAETADQFSDYFVLLEQVTVNLKVPVSYAEAYDMAIDMFTLDTRDELDLSGAEFQCFCRDVWDWSHEFAVTNMTYGSVRK